MPRLIALFLICSFLVTALPAEELLSSNQAKDPWEAARLSTLFPGLGQKYAGDEPKGDRLILETILGLGLTYSAHSRIAQAQRDEERYQAQYLYDFIAFAMAAGYLSNIFDAYKMAETIPAGEYYVERNPWEAAFRSALIPGWGYLYAEDYYNGLAISSTFLFLAVKSHNESYIFNSVNGPIDLAKFNGALLMGTMYVLGIIDSYTNVAEMNNRVKEREGRYFSLVPEYDPALGAAKIALSYQF